MALTSILRKSASSLAPLAGRLVRCQRNYHSALFTGITHTNVSHTLSPLVPNLHYSTASKRPSSDQTLLRVIESEIQCLQETDDHDRVTPFSFGYGLFGCWESVGNWKENGTFKAICCIFLGEDEKPTSILWNGRVWARKNQ